MKKLALSLILLLFLAACAPPLPGARPAPSSEAPASSSVAEAASSAAPASVSSSAPAAVSVSSAPAAPELSERFLQGGWAASGGAGLQTDAGLVMLDATYVITFETGGLFSLSASYSIGNQHMTTDSFEGTYSLDGDKLTISAANAVQSYVGDGRIDVVLIAEATGENNLLLTLDSGGGVGFPNSREWTRKAK